jgi:branched-chain amino acid transport system permease protein
MTNFLLGREALVNICMINAILALSQYVVLRAGVFSLATSGIAAIGAYTAGNLMLRPDLPPALGLLAGALLGGVVSVILAIPLARLRGVFQAIATLAFVQIVMSVALYADSITGGATGLNGIAKTIESWHLVLVLAVTAFALSRLARSPAGRAFDTIRQDETVAVSLGIDVVHYHRIAFALSGCIAGLAGGLMAGHNYAVANGEFGFHMMISVLSFVVFGGRTSVAGPIAGALLLTILPEVARPLADNRMILYGTLLIVAIVYLPNGVVDTWLLRQQRRRAAVIVPLPETASGAGARP